MLTPLNKNVLVKQDTAAEKTAGGLFIPENAREKASGRGTVLAMAPKAKEVLDSYPGEEKVRVGTVVAFQKYAGTRVGGTEDLLMIEADELLGFYVEPAGEDKA